MGAAERNDLLELLDDRIGTRSTLITSQLPVKAWHTYLNDPTLADAILDRVVHSSHKIELKGTQSMRDADAAAAVMNRIHAPARPARPDMSTWPGRGASGGLAGA